MFFSFYRILRPGYYGQWIVAFTACLCSFTSGQAFFWPGAALPKIRSGAAGFTMSSDEESWMVAFVFFGNILSPIPAGYIMDMIGRKNTLMLSDLLAVLSWVIIYFGKSAIAMYIARTLIGLWAGVIYTVVPVLIGEVVRPEIRGSMGALFGILLYLGGMYESLIGQYLDFNMFSLLSMVAPVILFVIFFFIPESPYFYLMKGRRQDAISSLEWLRGTCNIDMLDEMEECVKEQLENRGTFFDILKVRPYRRAFIIVESVAAIQRMAGLTLLASYASVTIPDSWITGSESFTVLTSVWIIGSIISFFIIDNFNRRPLFFVSCVGSTVTMAAISVWYYLRDFTSVSTETTTWFPLIGLCINGLFYALALISIPTMIQGEVFPVNIKSKASGIACITMSVMSGLSVRIYQPLNEYVGMFANFVVCGTSCAIGAVFAYTYMVETRGKTLEEIQDILSEKKRKRKKKNVFHISESMPKEP